MIRAAAVRAQRARGSSKVPPPTLTSPSSTSSMPHSIARWQQTRSASIRDESKTAASSLPPPSYTPCVLWRQPLCDQHTFVVSSLGRRKVKPRGKGGITTTSDPSPPHPPSADPPPAPNWQQHSNWQWRFTTIFYRRILFFSRRGNVLVLVVGHIHNLLLSISVILFLSGNGKRSIQFTILFGNDIGLFLGAFLFVFRSLDTIYFTVEYLACLPFKSLRSLKRGGVTDTRLGSHCSTYSVPYHPPSPSFSLFPTMIN